MKQVHIYWLWSCKGGVVAFWNLPSWMSQVSSQNQKQIFDFPCIITMWKPFSSELNIGKQIHFALVITVVNILILLTYNLSENLLISF